MSNPFVEDPIAGYNTNPPSNDGTESVSNTCDWDLHVIAKVGTPLKNYASANFTKIATAFTKVLGGAGVTNQASGYTILSSDQGKAIIYTGTGGDTYTTPDATIVGSPFVFTVQNNGTGVVTLDGHDTQTVNGATTLDLVPGDGGTVFTDGSNWIIVLGKSQPIIGEIKMFGMAALSPGFEECDGSAISRTTYASLFAVIGETFGVGDGASTFNLPDFQNRAPYGVGQGLTLEGDLAGTTRALADTFGYEDVTDPAQSHNTTDLTNISISGGAFAAKFIDDHAAHSLDITNPGLAVHFGIYSGVFT